ncbi:MerR family transcriptional regulator [Nocardia caishijiensis]|uniref:DNA-binding transcriptional MerR regulator n=1 Tax=Nocardia caishijiensis TaxID=184756 RepID=A0ABQ6YFH6_9NOCA|nr:MerR family transcriptional regulator [Nocardia caishijiensis]KAF0836743.1 DNA-binding transcriptional MerR regulator [Nocardia caishijiensis]
MTATVTIGEFARLTLLSVKTLRYYHEIELLEPVAVAPGSGYRRYSVDQVEQAHLIRRLRDLSMPLPRIREVLAAPGPAARDATLREHLNAMEAELQHTRDVVTSLRALLTVPAPMLRVEYRIEPACTALTRADRVARDAIGQWCDLAFTQLFETVLTAGVTPGGIAGATYSTEFFTDESGEVSAYLPLPADTALDPPPGLALTDMPARRYAVAVHTGAFDDFDRTYGALGTHVAEHDETMPDEPIRERYLVGPQHTDNPAEYRTEVCWPITEGESR